MRKRGRVLRDTNAGPGLLTAEGKQYSFVLEGMWRSEVPPRLGMLVDVHFDSEGAPATVYAVSDGQVEREVGREQAQATVPPDKLCRPESSVAGFGVPALLAQLLLLLSFFFLPSLLIGKAVGTRAISGWEAVSLHVATPGTRDPGVLGLLAIPCLLAPLVVPLLKFSWSRWLYAAPLGFAVLASVTLYMRFERDSPLAGQNVQGLLGGATTNQLGNQGVGIVSVNVGAYLLLICALYFAKRIARSRN